LSECDSKALSPYLGKCSFARHLINVPATTCAPVSQKCPSASRIFRFKAQHRWLLQHLDACQYLRLEKVPERTTLSRRSMALSSILQDFVAFVGQYAEALAPAVESHDLL